MINITCFSNNITGALPSVEDGIVTRTVCTQTSSGSCDSSWDINIKNCTDYNVYYLKSSQVSDSAYCFGEFKWFSVTVLNEIKAF